MQIIVSLLQQSKSGSVFIFYPLSGTEVDSHADQSRPCRSPWPRKRRNIQNEWVGGGGSYSRDGHLNK